MPLKQRNRGSHFREPGEKIWKERADLVISQLERGQTTKGSSLGRRPVRGRLLYLSRSIQLLLELAFLWLLLPGKLCKMGVLHLMEGGPASQPIADQHQQDCHCYPLFPPILQHLFCCLPPLLHPDLGLLCSALSVAWSFLSFFQLCYSCVICVVPIIGSDVRHHPRLPLMPLLSWLSITSAAVYLFMAQFGTFVCRI